MKKQFLLFAGTREGRELAEYMIENNIALTVCVATEYGETVLKESEALSSGASANDMLCIQTGRMDAEEMVDFIRKLQPVAVIDATHPYADVVTKNIREACAATDTPYERMLRKESVMHPTEEAGCCFFDNPSAAATWLEQQEGNILLTTGLKELPVFAGAISQKERIYARVLLQASVFEEMEACGLTKKQMICMQGPFSKEMNKATLQMCQARFLVTKESGAVGGFLEKVEAAQELGATCVVIRRPTKEEGLSPEEVRVHVRKLWGAEEKEMSGAAIAIAGIGMGSTAGMTVEVAEAIRRADCIIGAKRMLKSAETLADGATQPPMVALYKSEEIKDYIDAHPEHRRIVIVLSGDVGFYSGAKKLLEQLENHASVTLLPGISSAVYFAAKIGMAWEDMKLLSTHGREQNIVSAVRCHRKVFTLASDAKSICALAQKLADYGFGNATMYVGADFSYPTEAIYEATVSEFADFDKPGMFVAIICNGQAGQEPVTHGMPDEAFLRGKAPMTKEEVRSISLSKLRLTKDAVVYDIGAGTGSVSVECARMAEEGKVYAIERKEEAVELLHQNRIRFACDNLEIIKGLAPEAMEDLPAPTHAFIGGSAGNLKEIVQLLTKKNPAVRMVINCITLETVAETLAVAKELALEIEDLACITVAKSKDVGTYHMMMGQNPVYCVVLKECGEK